MNWILGLVLVPASMLTGFAAASMSFTAWNLVCPLLLSAFGVDVFPALFVSVMLDVTNGLTLTLLYGSHGKVDFNYGIKFGAISLGWAVLMSIILEDWIYEHQDKLKSAVSFVPLLIAIQFLIRGFLAWKRKRAADKAALEAPALAINDGEAQPIAAAGAKDAEEEPLPTSAASHPRSRVSLLGAEDSKDIIVAPPKPGSELSRRSETVPPVHVGSYYLVTGGLKDIEVDKKEQEAAGSGAEHDAEAQTTRLGVSAPRSYSAIPEEPAGGDDERDTLPPQGIIAKIRRTFKSEEDILAKELTNRGWRVGVTIVINSILGIVSGVLYAGGGMFFANVIVNFWSAKVRTAAGTGCFIMTIVMSAMSFTFIGRIGMNDINNLYNLLCALPFGVIGAILGAKLALRISDMVMYFVIVGVSLVLFAVIAINGIFIQDDPTTPPPVGHLGGLFM